MLFYVLLMFSNLFYKCFDFGFVIKGFIFGVGACCIQSANLGGNVSQFLLQFVKLFFCFFALL